MNILIIFAIIALIGIIVKQRLIISKAQEKAKQWKDSYNEVYNLSQEQKTQIEVLKRMLDA